MKRRHFIRNAASGILLPSVFHGLGVRSLGMENFASLLNVAEENDLTLVMIYLAGGNDGLNTLIPLSQIDTLNNVRPHVALKEEQVLKLGNLDMGLHPALSEMKNLYDEDRLAIIQNVGYPDPNFSHFRSTDIWVSGSDSDEYINSGWGGRYLDKKHPTYPDNYPNEDFPHPLAIEIGYSNSLMFQGSRSNLGFAINNPEDFYRLLEGEQGESPDTKGGERLDFIRLVAQQSQSYGERVKEAGELGKNMVDYNDSNYLAQQLKVVARLISGGLKTRLYLVELGGFDTHDNQVESDDHTQGEHATLLRKLSDGVGTFMQDCDRLQISDKILGMTFSEFGRRIISNASGGTDHGAAAPLFLFGDHVKGGLYGTSPIIPTDADWSSNVDMEFDFRQIYKTVLERYFCLNNVESDNILFHDFNSLDIIKDTECTTQVSIESTPVQDKTKIFPNPVADIIHIEIELPKGNILIDIVDAMGRKILLLDDFKHVGGKVFKSFNISSIKTGVYSVRIGNRSNMKAYSFVKK